MDDSAPRQVICYIDAKDHRTFQALINTTGIRHSPWFAGRIFLLGLELELANQERGKEWEKLPSKTRHALQLETLALHERRQEARQQTLNYLATRNLDQDRSSQLLKIAEDLELDQEEAASFSTSSFATVVAYSNNSTKKGQCIQWLAKLFGEETEIPRDWIFKTGGNLGFSEVIMKRAKRSLKLGHGQRKDGIWCWLAPVLITIDDT